MIKKEERSRNKFIWEGLIERPKNVPTLEEIMEYKDKGYKYEDIPRHLWDLRE